MRDDADLEDEVPTADAQEQHRPLVEEGFDPEQTATDPAPEAAGLQADPADVRDQGTEVPADDDHYPAS